MSKRGFIILLSILFVAILSGWFAYEKYWEYRVKEGAKALGYELNEEEVKYWVKRIRSYNRLDGFDEDIEKFEYFEMLSMITWGLWALRRSPNDNDGLMAINNAIKLSKIKKL